ITSGVPSAQRIALAVSAADPNRVYLLAGNGSGLVGLYQSTNSGTSFTARSTSPNILGYSETGADNNSQAWYDLVLAADPTNADIIYAGGINIWKSTNAGSNWSIVAHWVGSGGTADVHADHHVLEFSPHNSNLYNGNDGGIYFTPDGGANWSEITSGLAIAQIYKIGVAQTNPEIVINGYQDNGTGLYFEGSWYTIVGGDGMECIVDPTDDNYVYTALYYGDIRRSTSGGNGFARIADNGVNGITESGDWVTPYKLDPTNPARMFIGYSNIWRSDDVKNPGSNAIVWDQISSFTGTSSIRDLAIAPSSNDVMYVARNRNGERFLRTTNLTAANPTWTNLHSSLPFNSTPKDIEIDPADPNHVYIAIGNSVYESTNAGSNWTNISGTLPNISANTLVIDPESPVGAIYVGMDVGVYYRDNTMSDWVMYATGLPSVEVTELEIHSNGTNCRSQIFAATYGQGLWTGDLKDPGNTAPVACFEADQTNVCQGQPILFTSYSDYTPTGWTWSISPNTFTYQGGTNANSENPQISFNAPGTYTISLDASNGIGSDNETKSAYITVSSASNANTFSDDFESYPTCATTTNCGTGTCAITGNWNNLNNGTDDDIDWRVDAGGTPSTNTGPNTDFNPGNASGNYAYTEASNCFGATAILESSCILMDQNYNFQFAYHMSGANMGTIHLDINTSGTWIEDFVTPLSGDQGTAWQTRTIDMSAYTGQTISLRLRGITGSAFESDLAIDDLQFLPITTLNTQIKSFYANCETGGKNELQLTVDNVTQGSSLRIERLNNKTQTWEIFEEIELKKEITSYIIEDNNPALGDNYYRLLSNNAQQETQILQTTVSQCSFDEHTLNVFPNPFEKGFSIQMHSGYNGTLAYSLQNLLGQQLRQGTFSLEEGLNTFEVNFEDLPQGVYLLHLGDSNPQIIKMVKQH
ncbi:MAG: T9SS type A sorting domain-containing protein, partial [Saprospiraceae bacterium]|nr:T9SS type A sorting domain-containing protein [Saprospiraceae bacterium]